jgi:hypothetical protein
MLSYTIKQELTELRDKELASASRSEQQAARSRKSVINEERWAQEAKQRAHDYQQLLDSLAFAPAPTLVEDTQDHTGFAQHVPV